MARFRRPSEMTRGDLGRLLDRELPLPDSMVDRDGWRWVMERRRDRAAEFGFSALDVILISRDARRARATGGAS